MNSILLVSSSINARHTLIDMIQAIDCRYQFKSVNSGSEARREVENYSYDVIIINYPLVDELGDSLACEISNKYSASVILIVKPDILADLDNRLFSYGVMSIAKPLSRPLFNQLVKASIANANKIRRLYDENNKLKKKYEELKYVSKAKALLIKKGYTEDEAHHYIEKRAMDERISKLQISIDLINKCHEEAK